MFSCKCYSILTWNEQSEFGVYKKKTKEKVDWLVSIFNFYKDIKLKKFPF